MKRIFLFFVMSIPMVILSCAQGPEIPERVEVDINRGDADVLLLAEAVPDEDGSFWPEHPMDQIDDNSSMRLMASNDPPGYIEVYTDKMSYLPGETINFHVSTTAQTYAIEIRAEEWTRRTVGRVEHLPGVYYPVPPVEERPWAKGANWPVSYSWVVPDEWENGSYTAFVYTTSSDTAYAYRYHPFIVRSVVPGSHSRIAFLMNYNTRNAYNDWGEKSLYRSFLPKDRHYGVCVSFQRPLAQEEGRGVNYWGQWMIPSQLIDFGLNPEFITEWDVYSNPTILRAYDVVVLANHHEYISRNTYDSLEAHHYRGGHLAFFSANDIWWQVRFEDNGNKMVSYKSYAYKEDPIKEIDISLLTTRWDTWPVSRPPQALRGTSYVRYSWCFEQEDYIVQDSNHFIFKGTDLQNGDVFCSNIAMGETDYIGPFSPSKIDIVLAARRARPLRGYENYVPFSYIDAAATYYEDSPEYGFPDGRGGQVFCSGTHSGWGRVVYHKSPGYETGRKVTLNILQHMLDASPPAPDFKDLVALTSHWLGPCSSPGWCDYTDVDMNGIVELYDFAHFAKSWYSD